MKEIDWSKAPEGATHCTPVAPHDINLRPVFWRVADGVAREAWPMSDDYSKVKDHFRYGDGGCSGFDISRAVKRPAPTWTGEGRPPVGAAVVLDDCLYGVFADYQEMIGPEVEVLASFRSPHGLDMIACAMPNGLCGCFRAEMARPIRTPEQIAAEEREKAVCEMLTVWRDCGSARDFCEYLFDHGYRKTEGGTP